MNDRALARATLARQYLMERADVSTLEAVSHLAGLQAQAPVPPYLALWARLKNFAAEDLSTLIENRHVVRLVAMRGTVFALSVADAATFRGTVQSIMERDLHTNTAHRAALTGMDFEALAQAGRELVSEGPLTQMQMRPLLAECFPDRAPEGLAHAVRGLLPMVQVPPRGLWGRSGAPALTTLEDWLGTEVDLTPRPDALVLRYLAAFGPASVKDAQAWSGLTRLGEVFERLRSSLITFKNENGTELFDLPDAPRPDSGTPPVRILAPFDNILLSHADRSRILDKQYRSQVFTVNGIIKPAVLVRGQVAGFATVSTTGESARLAVTLFAQQPKTVIAAIEREGRSLLKFLHPAISARDVSLDRLT
ncbi:winged helix DNA-binding domain-containing protein [Rhodococcus sp. ARC_M6]|uniref:winged helix DNA-binding domain-containing protein n=1 Tax=Rhodococcus sp. ARC_M6 TaxID=2928852 RepID=UPI001FB267A1|nr:winged helix DNA-binding domain-containing protein [Rhodococcus sp. ARC_M6]MCJ0904696.1 winged helix DNA-binding domain-containing protein [Rhodococcus sp. ARC_M6]